jgi:predicted DCC family thiol-disulfide oxidoreductase YuxK
MPPHVPDPSPIVFYDGECGLCHRFVQFILARDHAGTFRFAPLQGPTAARLVPGCAATLGSVVLKDETGVYQKSEASLRVLARLGGLWVLTTPLRAVPPVVRDAVYDFIAKRRYRWFGTADACALPPPSAQPRFLP